MANEALSMTSASPLALTAAGYGTHQSYGGFERTGTANAHRARMASLMEEQKAINEARRALDEANRRKGIATLLGGAATAALGLGGIAGEALPANVAMAGGNLVGSLAGAEPASGVLSLVGGGLEYGRHQKSLSDIQNAAPEYGWNSGSVLAQ